MRVIGRLGGLNLAVVAFVALICSPFLGVGLYEAYQNRKQIAAFTQTKGRVVGNSYATVSHDGTPSGAYYPVVEFADSAGAPVRFQDGVGSLPPDYEVGAEVEVVYDPGNPSAARINTWKRMWLAPAIFITIGLLPPAIAAFVMGAVQRSLNRAVRRESEKGDR